MKLGRKENLVFKRIKSKELGDKIWAEVIKEFDAKITEHILWKEIF